LTIATTIADGATIILHSPRKDFMNLKNISMDSMNCGVVE
jgi:hypothetical protein